MPDLIKISGGAVYDPANGIDGEVRDLWIEGGRMVAARN
jgi:formylmethanofuran dehydrogenase subunit A